MNNNEDQLPGLDDLFDDAEGEAKENETNKVPLQPAGSPIAAPETPIVPSPTVPGPVIEPVDTEGGLIPNRPPFVTNAAKRAREKEEARLRAGSSFEPVVVEQPQRTPKLEAVEKLEAQINFLKGKRGRLSGDLDLLKVVESSVKRNKGEDNATYQERVTETYRNYIQDIAENILNSGAVPDSLLMKQFREVFKSKQSQRFYETIMWYVYQIRHGQVEPDEWDNDPWMKYYEEEVDERAHVNASSEVNQLYKKLEGRSLGPVRKNMTLEETARREVGKIRGEDNAAYQARVEAKVDEYLEKIAQDLIAKNTSPYSSLVQVTLRFRLGKSKERDLYYKKLLAKMQERLTAEGEKDPGARISHYADWLKEIADQEKEAASQKAPEREAGDEMDQAYDRLHESRKPLYDMFDMSDRAQQERAAAAVESLMENASLRERIVGSIDRLVPSWARPTREQLVFLAGGSVAGFAIKRGLTLGLSAAGVAGFPATIAIGGIGGAGVAAIKEYATQVRSNWTDQDRRYLEAIAQLNQEYDAMAFGLSVSPLHEADKIQEEIKLKKERSAALIAKQTEIKNRLATLKPTDLKRLGRKTLMGAATGSIGAVVGFEIAGLITDHSDEILSALGGLKDRLPIIGGGIPETKPTVSPPAPAVVAPPAETAGTNIPPAEVKAPSTVVTSTEPLTQTAEPPGTAAPEKTHTTNMPFIGGQSPGGVEGALPPEGSVPGALGGDLSGGNPAEQQPPLPQTGAPGEAQPPAATTASLEQTGVAPPEAPAPRAGFTVPAESFDQPGAPRPPLDGTSTITASDNGLGTTPAAAAPAQPSGIPGEASAPAGGEAAQAGVQAEAQPGTPEYADKVVSEVFPQESEPLKAGSTLWNEAKGKLTAGLGHEPSNAQIQELTKVLAKENGVGVPEWGISGSIDARTLPVGYKVVYNDAVKNAFKGMITK